MNEITSPPSRSTTARGGGSLRTKSTLFLLLLFAYSIALAGYVLYQKSKLVEQLAVLAEIQEQESALVEADLAAFSAITELFMIVDPQGRDAVLNRVHVHFTQLQRNYSRLESLYPDRADAFKAMLRLLAETIVRPDTEHLVALRDQLADNKARLDQLLSQNRARRQSALNQYLNQSNRVALQSLSLGVCGLVALGIVVAVFFGRLTSDLLRLHRRVDQIVQGYRGAPLQARRNDEVGELIAGVNEMADRLRGREQELEIERYKQFHLDKMGAIGHLAAGIVHEVGNPVAAILGLAQECKDALNAGDEREAGDVRNTRDELDREQLAANIDYIAQYAERLRLISEDLAAFNRPRREPYELLDINELIANIENILRYDERWYGIRLVTDMDQGVSAIRGASDQLSQLIMNLVVNSLESIDPLLPRQGQVVVKTRRCDDGVQVEVRDNGCGISAEEQARVFDAFYTTKDAKGSGLGLLLSSSIVTDHGGYIRLESTPGEGTCVRVFLPYDSRKPVDPRVESA